ncbi:FGGY family carbohydrate kinase [Microbacterium sp. KSW2-21]|uniref:FGGY family carbohydrate kinase n=1 Tax=Microbacterium algihabitans TaxID=3075992 RepID=A0ABU3RWX3_9MICO|nr:FGGY family carbohydrate kinase [Microbacterium sp. KSW2-21]MDU0327369.1 FGGY family carbohydrate kinase [Microbacterium sp. KSW2-21]
MTLRARLPVAVGIDVGSTNTKVVAVTADGAVVARASRPTRRAGTDLAVDAAALVLAIEDMVVEVCGDSRVIHALCVAGIGEDGVLVDAGLRPLTPALAWFDPRRHAVFDALRPELVGDDTFDVDTDPVRSLVGWRWARAQAGADRAAAWIALTDLPSVSWTGRAFLSDTLAPRTAAWRSGERAWAHDRVTLTLGDERLLPPVVATGDVVGEIVSPALRAAGVVTSDAIAVAGGHDHPIGGWGVQLMVPGAVLDSMGTAEVVVAQSASSRVRGDDHVDVAPGIRASGSTLLRVEELARNVQWASRDAEVARAIRHLLIGRAEPLPVWESGWFVPGQRGGGQPSYAVDAPADPRARASAVLGALAVAGRDAVDAVRHDVGGVAEVRMAGGWVRSPGWIALKAAVNGAPAVPVLEPEVTAVGAALLAATARGWTPDPVDALGGFVSGMLG